MITITREVNQSIVIDRDIVVTVLEVTSERVRLGISNPRQTPPYEEHTIYLNDNQEEAEQAECEFQLQ